jgi:geranylgeranyl diphosphate synthase type II
MGKQPGSDVAKDKKTYPALLGVPRAKESAKEHVNEAIRALDLFGKEATPLREIANYLLIRKA